MSRKSPSITAKQLVRFLKKQGFVEDRQRGSHLTLVKDDKTVTVPVHTGTKLGKGLLKALVKSAGYTIQAFNKLR